MKKKALTLTLAISLMLSLCIALISNPVQAASSSKHSFSVSGTFDYDEAFEVLSQLNKIRAEVGLPALIMKDDLLESAMQRAVELSIYFSHTRPDGTDCFTAFADGYSYKGENIASGYKNATDVSQGWKNSPGHYANMINGYYDSVGIGCFYQEDGTKGWVQLFGRGGTSSVVSKFGKMQSTKTITALEEMLTLTVSPESATISVNETQAFTLYNEVNAGWQYASRVKINPSYFHTSNSEIAIISTNGTARGVGVGNTILKIGIAEDLFASVFINVEKSGGNTDDEDFPPSPSPIPQPSTATPTNSTVFVNGGKVSFDAYNINDNNYFKLRDLAYILSGTQKQFEVTWDAANNTIILASGKAYTVVGGEMASKGNGAKTATPTASKIYLDGKEVVFTAYNIDGNNYFKLRDIGAAFNFGVAWDGANNRIIIDTSIGYTPE